MGGATVPPSPQDEAAALAKEIVRRAPRDVVFTMTFIGETRQRLFAHFEAMIAREIEARGADLTDDLMRPFIDEHAAKLRDFVVTGTALTRQFRLEDIEALMGDRTMLTRVDLWDALTDHIDAAQKQFLAQADEIPALLADLRRTREKVRAP